MAGVHSIIQTDAAARRGSTRGQEVFMTFRGLMVGLLGVVASVPAFASEGSKPEADWLVGTWVLCEDPDNGSRDSLQFNADGTGFVILAKGNAEFLHRHAGQSVSLLVNAKGYALPIELSASVGFDRLSLYSERTGNTSSYVRADGPLVASCSIQ
jgi:hypothetical protein